MAWDDPEPVRLGCSGWVVGLVCAGAVAFVVGASLWAILYGLYH